LIDMNKNMFRLFFLDGKNMMKQNLYLVHWVTAAGLFGSS
jgi:hypothetical protein